MVMLYVKLGVLRKFDLVLLFVLLHSLIAAEQLGLKLIYVLRIFVFCKIMLIILPIKNQNEQCQSNISNSIYRINCIFYITVNNNQYQFIKMQVHYYPYKHHHSRELTFSPLQNVSKTSIDSVERKSKDKNRNMSPLNNNTSYRNASPLHNLHYKYLPDNYISPERVKDNKENIKSRYRQKENQNRTEGILKINSKIKNILQSIEQEQKRKEMYADKFINNDVYGFDEKVKVYSNTPNTRYNYTPKSIEKKEYAQIGNRIEYKTPLKDKNLNELQINNISNTYNSNSSIKKQTQQQLSANKIKQYPTSSIRQRQYKQYDQNEQKLSTSSASYNLTSSRYHNYSVSRIKKMKDQAVIIKGKNVDNQIDKIQIKIEEFQKLKKSIHIDYQASKVSKIQQKKSNIKEVTIDRQQIRKDSKFTERSDLRKSIIDTYSKITQNQNKRQESSMNQADISEMKSSISCGMVKSQIYNPRQKLSTQDVHIPKLLRNLNSKRKKQQKKPTNQIVNFNQIESSVSQFFNTNAQTPLTIQSSRGLPPLSIATQINAAVTSLATAQQEKSQLKRLLSCLQHQIKTDQQLRKAKKWFKSYKDQGKWQKLQTTLKDQGKWINRNKMKQIYAITSQEQNPFYTPRQADFSIKNLISIYQQSQNHWSKNILHNFCKNKLKQNSFIQQNIDISKRGTISIEDIVRFINFQLQTFYRNRDIYLIYVRLRKQMVLSFKDILECFTKINF